MAAVNQVSIVNSALVKIGAATISSIDDTDSRQAQLAKTLYDYLRDEILRDHPWKCAAKRAVLYPTDTAPLFEWEFAYDLPNDWIRTIALYDNTAGEDVESFVWTEESHQILCDSSPVYLHYVFQNTDESSWDAQFAEAFAWRIAMELAYPLTQSLALAQACEKQYESKLANARSISGMGGTLKPLIADTWTNARI